MQPLCTLPAGATGCVLAVRFPDDDPCRDRLLAMGVTPGAPLTVLQTFPAVVFLCDGTELVVERPVAEAILVIVAAAADARSLSRAR